MFCHLPNTKNLPHKSLHPLRPIITQHLWHWVSPPVPVNWLSYCRMSIWTCSCSVYIYTPGSYSFSNLRHSCVAMQCVNDPSFCASQETPTFESQLQPCSWKIYVCTIFLLFTNKIAHTRCQWITTLTQSFWAAHCSSVTLPMTVNAELHKGKYLNNTHYAQYKSICGLMAIWLGAVQCLLPAGN